MVCSHWSTGRLCLHHPMGSPLLFGEWPLYSRLHFVDRAPTPPIKPRHYNDRDTCGWPVLPSEPPEIQYVTCVLIIHLNADERDCPDSPYDSASPATHHPTPQSGSQLPTLLSASTSPAPPTLRKLASLVSQITSIRSVDLNCPYIRPIVARL